MNKALITERFSRAVETYTIEATAQMEIAYHMIELLNQHLKNYTPQSIVEFGCGTGNYSRLLYRTFMPETFIINDICKEMMSRCDDLIKKGVQFEEGDAEQLAFQVRCNILTSCSTLQWFTSPERFFERSANFISTDGYLAFSTFGEDNFKEIKATTGSGLNYYNCDKLLDMLSPYYDIIHMEEQYIVQHYEHPLDVLRHLKQTGVTGIQSYQWTKGKLTEFSNAYQLNFTDDKGVTLTYHPIYVIAKKKQS